MARDTRRGKTASGGWTQARRDAQSRRARKLHEEGKLGGGKTIAKTVAEDANVSVAERLRGIISDPKSKSSDVMRASKELRMIGVHVPDAEDDIEELIVTAIHDAIYPLIGIGLALGGPARDRMRDYLGAQFTDADEQEIIAHVTDTLHKIGREAHEVKPLATQLREDSPPLAVLLEIRAKAAARGVVLAHAPSEDEEA